jgi:meiotically up-regulated gene 157 (Mug157) protein
MKPGVGERKWEVDSLCYTIRFAHGYWQTTGDASPFDAEWREAAREILWTFQEQQRLTSRGPHSFERLTTNPLDTVPLNGYGNPARSVGMIFSMFRPLDDCCVDPLFVPANLFAARALAQLAEIASAVSASAIAKDCDALARSVRTATEQYSTVQHPKFGEIWAYEVDGYGDHLMRDDANAPGLLSLPYLGCSSVNAPIYRRTREFVLSESTPYFFQGMDALGLGSPHTGLGYIWPIGIIMRALTATDDAEVVQCLKLAAQHNRRNGICST